MEIFPNWTAIPIILFLVILTFILNRTFFRPLAKALEERFQRIEGARREAEEIRIASQERLAEFDRRLREARRESDSQMAQIKNEALSEKNSIVSQKRSEAEKTLAESRAEIRKKAEQASVELEAHSDGFARQIATQILRRPVKNPLQT